MLTAKGYEVGFKTLGGKKILAPASYAMLHDPTGDAWGKNSILVASFRRLGGGIEIDNEEAEEYFGYIPLKGKLVPPPRAIGAWNFVDEVERIDYWRPGEYTDKRGHYHPFEDGGWRFESKPKLYRRGRLLRLELGPGAQLNWRGFVYP